MTYVAIFCTAEGIALRPLKGCLDFARTQCSTEKVVGGGKGFLYSVLLSIAENL